MLKNKLKGFTLAEVLVAMTVVGIVAALTIPALTTNSQAKANKVKAKKAYATIATATSAGIAMADYDYNDVTSMAGGSPSVANILNRNLKARGTNRTAGIAGELPLNSSGNDCDATSVTYSTANAKYCNSLKAGSIAGTFLLPDGSHLILLNTKDISTNGCTSTAPCIGLIDINGEKEPNNVIMCTSGTNNIWTVGANPAAPEACSVNDSAITDIYPIIFYGDTVEPATSAAMAILEGE